ncbi:MAG: sulfatase-like hydrolase/transferase [Pseudomonadales bacterium]|nr:sulfatase-like hydrolase/transferase [Pseudomonadales bacterium]
MQQNPRFSLKSDLAFIAITVLWLLVFQGILRSLFLYFHADLARDIPGETVLSAFGIGLRFDMIIAVYGLLPLLFAFLSPLTEKRRRIIRIWLTVYGTLLAFLAVLELDFYQEFHQRLNSLVFEYVKEDPETVLSMIWYGFPVIRYLILIGFLASLFHFAMLKADRLTQAMGTAPTKNARLVRLGVFVPVLLLAAVGARGTLRHGPPLRWGDAFFSQYTFANHLGLNGAFTLAKAATALADKKDANAFWFKQLPNDQATDIVRSRWMLPNEQLIDSDSAVLRRITTPPVNTTPPKNVVIILMESFSGFYTGALGGQKGITPAFDELTKEGLLFERFFSNGTHTHQGVFASLSCFPNVPGHEYLMQQPEGAHSFSGISAILPKDKFSQLFVYNGSFSWDNQVGFFQNQGMSHFVGREDYINPKFSDPTWGVSDEDMFNRAISELDRLPDNKPFVAILQTLSNHTPYALPDPLPMPPVIVNGAVSERLTAMRYSDYALGEFFKTIKDRPYYKNTLFVIVGDHGFGVQQQLTAVDLLRFHVPLLLIGPGIVEKHGHLEQTVGSQIDIVPTVMSLLGKPYQHQCWGRDLLNLPDNDRGIAVIKPSGNDPTVALVSDSHLLVRGPDGKRILYQYHFRPDNAVTRVDDTGTENALWPIMQAFVQSALISLRDNTSGPENE